MGDRNAQNDLLYLISSFLYSIIRVRGKKHAGVYFSNDLTLFGILSSSLIQIIDASKPWKYKYVLFYWTSIILLNPYQFDVSDDNHLETMKLLTSAAQSCYQLSDPLGEVSSHFLAILLSRRFYPVDSMCEFLIAACEEVLEELTVEEKEVKCINFLLFLNDFSVLVDCITFVSNLAIFANLFTFLSEMQSMSERMQIYYLKSLYRIATRSLSYTYEQCQFQPMYVILDRFSLKSVIYDLIDLNSGCTYPLALLPTNVMRMVICGHSGLHV